METHEYKYQTLWRISIQCFIKQSKCRVKKMAEIVDNYVMMSDHNLWTLNGIYIFFLKKRKKTFIIVFQMDFMKCTSMNVVNVFIFRICFFHLLVKWSFEWLNFRVYVCHKQQNWHEICFHSNVGDGLFNKNPRWTPFKNNNFPFLGSLNLYKCLFNSYSWMHIHYTYFRSNARCSLQQFSLYILLFFLIWFNLKEWMQ